MLKKPGPILCLSCFQILKEIYLEILKKPTPIFALSTFSNIKKSILTNLIRNLFQFIAYQLFKYSEKLYLKI